LYLKLQLTFSYKYLRNLPNREKKAKEALAIVYCQYWRFYVLNAAI
jgi:hypothetical protein